MRKLFPLVCLMVVITLIILSKLAYSYAFTTGYGLMPELALIAGLVNISAVWGYWKVTA